MHRPTKMPERLPLDWMAWYRADLQSSLSESILGGSIEMTDIFPTEDQIVQAIQTDREQALAQLFQAAAPRLRRIAGFRLDYRLSGRVSESDVIQETFVRAAARIDHFLAKPEMPFFVWLRLELSQKLHDIHRYHLAALKRDPRKESPLGRVGTTGYEPGCQTSLAIAARLVANQTSPSRWLQKAEQIAMLEKSLSELPELDREVIALRHFEELSNQEASQVLGIDPSAASKRYLRALKRLKDIMSVLESDHDA